MGLFSRFKRLPLRKLKRAEDLKRTVERTYTVLLEYLNNPDISKGKKFVKLVKIANKKFWEFEKMMERGEAIAKQKGRKVRSFSIKYETLTKIHEKIDRNRTTLSDLKMDFENADFLPNPKDVGWRVGWHQEKGYHFGPDAADTASIIEGASIIANLIS